MARDAEDIAPDDNDDTSEHEEAETEQKSWGGWASGIT